MRFAVLVDDVVHLGAVEDEVVDAVAGDGVEGELEREAVIDVGVGGGVPDDAVAFGGDEEGDGYVGVVLGDFDGGAAIVEHAALVLAEAVEGFGGVGPEAVDDVEGGVVVEGDGVVGAGDAVAFAEEGLVVGCGEGEVAAGEGDGGGEGGGFEGGEFFVLGELKGCTFAGLVWGE